MKNILLIFTPLIAHVFHFHFYDDDFFFHFSLKKTTELLMYSMKFEER